MITMEQMIAATVDFTAISLFSLIGLMFLCIIGVYRYVYKASIVTTKQLGDIYKTVNGHIQQTTIHVKDINLVKKEVCDVRHESIVKDLAEIKSILLRKD